MPYGNKLTCPRNTQGLWTFQETFLQNNQANTQDPTAQDTMAATTAPAINWQTNTPADLVAFAHAALFSPALSTLKRALAMGFIPPFIGLTETSLNRYPPTLEATAMGHLDAHRKNTRSTKTTDVTRSMDPNDAEDDCFPQQPVDNSRMNTCFLATTKPKHILYTDQTGRLPQPSSNGNNYLMVAYNYNSNNILLRPIKN